jgi:hypothetical protein
MATSKRAWLNSEFLDIAPPPIMPASGLEAFLVITILHGRRSLALLLRFRCLFDINCTYTKPMPFFA